MSHPVDISSPERDTPRDEALRIELEHDVSHVADELPEATLPPRQRRWRRWLKWGIAAVVVGFVSYALWGQLQEASAAEVAFRWPWAILATFTLTGLYVAIMASERALLQAFTGVHLPWREMIPVAWVPLAGRYIPGKVASVAGAVVLLRRIGVSTATGLSIFVLLDAMPLLSGMMLCGLLLLDPAVREQVPVAWGLFGLLLAVGLVCVHPAVFGRIINTMLRVLRRPPLPHVPRLRDYAQPAGWSLVQWFFNGLAVLFMCVAFAPPGQAPGLVEFPRIVGITALVMCVSYLSAFLTPGGFGVREGIFIPLLATLLPLPAATAATLALRVAHTLVEILLCGLGLLLLRGVTEAGDETAVA